MKQDIDVVIILIINICLYYNYYIIIKSRKAQQNSKYAANAQKHTLI